MMFLHYTSGHDVICTSCAETTIPFSLLDGWLCHFEEIELIEIDQSTDTCFCDGCGEIIPHEEEEND